MITIMLVLLIIIIIFVVIIIIIMAFPPPESIPTLESVSAPFLSADFTKLPNLLFYTARDGSNLAYREYLKKQSKQTVVVVHGSSASGISMHPLANYLHKQGMTVYTLDVRGHGSSGPKGDISYIGQLEDDLEDFVIQVLKQRKAAIIGHSIGGGFVLRFAAGERQNLFNKYILLSPYMGVDSPTMMPRSGGWVVMSLPRFLGILILGPLGRKLFGHLPVITYAIDQQTKEFQTEQYSFRLLRNFSPHANYRSDISLVKQPLMVIAGKEDEIFKADAFEALFTKSRPGTKVTLVPGMGHVTLITESKGCSAIAKAVIQK